MKRRFKVITLVFVVLVTSILCVLYFVGYFKTSAAGIRIETTPVSKVYINGEEVGKTPYKETYDPGEVTVKLIPESFESPLAPYETKVRLVSGIETVITREFGGSEELSGGEIISFEKDSNKSSSLSVVSVPDSAQISINGVTKGFAPYHTSDILEGEQNLKITAKGFLERNINVHAYEGYKLTVVVKLIPSEEVEILVDEQIDKPTEEADKVDVKIKILSTPTGFLRVRNNPETSGDEIGRVTPGKEYLYVEETEDKDWFKIEYEEGKVGWVSSSYAEKVEVAKETEVEKPTQTVTPTPKVSN